MEWRDMNSSSDTDSERTWEREEDDSDLEKGIGERKGGDLKRRRSC